MRPAQPVEVSLVVPTRDRADAVCRTLDALGRQTASPSRFEVLVVANGCSDDTAARVNARVLPYRHHVIERREAGMAAARNAGASAAAGRVLVFLDDDIEPVPGFVEAHAAAHASGDRIVAVGPLLRPAGAGAVSLLVERLQRLDAAFAASLADADRPLDWQSATGGNMSMTAGFFARTGGFDGAMASYGGEDYELAIRAASHGARFVFLAGAGGYHHRAGDGSVAGYLERARSAGQNAARIVSRHPSALEGLPIGRVDRPRSAAGRMARALAFSYPAVGDAAARAARGGTTILAAIGWRRGWNRLVDGLFEYWYWRGVGDEFGDAGAVAGRLAALRRAAERRS